MEQRKLIRLGNSSFAIALPKDWVDKSGLKKGDEIFVERNSNGEIIISPEFKKINREEKKVEINVDGKDEKKLKRELTSDYISGNFVFEFVGNLNKEKRKIIKNLVNDYIGCEVAEENDKNVIVKDFFNFEELNINNFIRRIDNNIREMFDIIIESVDKNKITKNNIQEINKIDLDINKFYFLNSRIMMLGLDNPSLINKLKIEPKDLFNNWWLSFQLEHTGDDLKAIAERLKSENMNTEIKKLLSSILINIKEKYENTLKAFYTKDKNKAYGIMEQGKKLLVSCENLTESKNAFLSIMGERLKEINNASYQIVKMIANFKK